MFWNNVKKLLSDHEMTQKELCEKLDLNVGTIKNQISKNTYPDIETLIKISKLFDVSTDFLLFDKTPQGLSGHQARLLETYNKLPSICKQMAITHIEGMWRQLNGEYFNVETGRYETSPNQKDCENDEPDTWITLSEGKETINHKEDFE